MNKHDIIQQHFQQPYNMGLFDAAEENVVTAFVQSSTQGKAIRLQVKLDAKQHIEDTRFKAHGCPYTIAVASLISQMLMGKSLAQIQMITGKIIAEELKLPKDKVFSALLGEDAIKQILRNIKRTIS